MVNLQRPERCPGCDTLVQVDLFPAWFRPIAAGALGEQILVEGEASCFYHPAKKAVQSCDACGRFLCGLCDCELQNRHFCPACLESGRQKGKIKNLQNQRTRHDKIALALAILPVLTFYFTLVTAPLALYIVIRHWKSPLSVIPHTRWRYVTAAVLSIAQIVGWSIGAYFLVKSLREG